MTRFRLERIYSWLCWWDCQMGADAPIAGEGLILTYSKTDGNLHEDGPYCNSRSHFRWCRSDSKSWGNGLLVADQACKCWFCDDWIITNIETIHRLFFETAGLQNKPLIKKTEKNLGQLLVHPVVNQSVKHWLKAPYLAIPIPNL